METAARSPRAEPETPDPCARMDGPCRRVPRRFPVDTVPPWTRDPRAARDARRAEPGFHERAHPRQEPSARVSSSAELSDRRRHEPRPPRFHSQSLKALARAPARWSPSSRVLQSPYRYSVASRRPRNKSGRRSDPDWAAEVRSRRRSSRVPCCFCSSDERPSAQLALLFAPFFSGTYTEPLRSTPPLQESAVSHHSERVR